MREDSVSNAMSMTGQIYVLFAQTHNCFCDISEQVAQNEFLKIFI